MSFKGDLSTIGLAEVFQMISMSQKEGTLIVEDGESKKSIYFGSTGIKLVSTGSRKGMKLGDILLRAGKVSEGQLSEALENARILKKMVGEVLVEGGFVTDAEIQQVVREQIEEEIYDLFLWKKANFEFIEGPDARARDADAPVTRLSFDVNGLLLEAVRRADEWNVINQSIPSLDSIFVFSSEAARAEEDGVASDALKRVYRLIDGATSIAEIVEFTGVPKFEACKSLVDLQSRERIRLLNVEETLSVALKRMEEGQKEKALRIYRAAAAQAPDDPKVLAGVAHVLEREGLVKEAASAYVKVGRAFLERGELDRALDYTQQASRMNPDDLEIRFGMFEIHAAAGNLADGKKLGAELILHCLMAPDYTRGRVLCERILGADPTDVDFHVLRARILHRTNQKKDLDEELGWIRRNMPADSRRAEQVEKSLQEIFVRSPTTRAPTTVRRPAPARGRMFALIGAGILVAGVLGVAGWYELTSSGQRETAVAEAQKLLDQRQYAESRSRIEAFLASTLSPTQKKKAREFLQIIEDRQEQERRAKDELEERIRSQAAGKMKALDAKIEESLNSNPEQARQDAEELEKLAQTVADPHYVQRAGAHLAAIKGILKKAQDLADRAAALEGEEKPREAALLVDELLAKYSNTPAARGALYPLWITSRPGGVTVVNMVTGQEIGAVPALGPFKFKMPASGSVRLKFEKAGYRSVERPIADKTAGRIHVDLLEKQEAWVNTLGVTLTGEPLLVEDTLYLASSNKLYAIRVQPGFLFGWAQLLEGNVEGRPCPGGKDRLFVSTNTPILYAIDPTAPAARRIAWRFDAGDRLSGPPGLSPDGTFVVVGTSTRSLVALDAREGKLLWRREVPGEVRVEPVVAGGAIAVACDDGTMMAIQGPGSEEKWKWKANGSLGPMAVEEGVLYSVAADQMLHAVDPSTGRRIWNYVLPGRVQGRVGRSIGAVYAAGRDGRVFLVQADTGSPLPPMQMGVPAPGGVVAAGPWVLVGNDSLTCIDGGLRQLGWRFRLPKDKVIRYPPAIGGGWVYFILEDAIYAVELN
jgi:outer membrane protein assembly factor BamB